MRQLPSARPPRLTFEPAEAGASGLANGTAVAPRTRTRAAPGLVLDLSTFHGGDAGGYAACATLERAMLDVAR